MKRSKGLWRVVSSGFGGLALVFLVGGADDAKQTIDAKGLDVRGPRFVEVEPAHQPDAPGAIESGTDRGR